MFVSILPSSKFFLNMILTVSSRGTFVNKLITLNDIILYFLGILSFFRPLMKSGVLIIVQSELPNGASKFAKHFAVLTFPFQR